MNILLCFTVYCCKCSGTIHIKTLVNRYGQLMICRLANSPQQLPRYGGSVKYDQIHCCLLSDLSHSPRSKRFSRLSKIKLLQGWNTILIMIDCTCIRIDDVNLESLIKTVHWLAIYETDFTLIYLD